MKFTFDRLADAFYIHFQKGKVDKTIKFKKDMLIDVDKKGKLLGLEILEASKKIPKRNLENVSIHIPSAVGVGY